MTDTEEAEWLEYLARVKLKYLLTKYQIVVIYSKVLSYYYRTGVGGTIERLNRE